MKRKHALALALVWALVSALQPAQASLMPLYQESVSGDLDGTLTLSTSGTVSGTISAAWNPDLGWQGHHGDSFHLALAIGKRLTGIGVDYNGSATVGNVSSMVHFRIDPDFTPYSHPATGTGSGQAQLFGATDLLPLDAADLLLGSAYFGIGHAWAGYASGPKPSGTVGLAYSYTLSFTVEDVPAVTVPVPEPASPALWLGGLSASWLATRRRSRRPGDSGC